MDVLNVDWKRIFDHTSMIHPKLGCCKKLLLVVSEKDRPRMVGKERWFSCGLLLGMLLADRSWKPLVDPLRL